MKTDEVCGRPLDPFGAVTLWEIQSRMSLFGGIPAETVFWGFFGRKYARIYKIRRILTYGAYSSHCGKTERGA